MSVFVFLSFAILDCCHKRIMDLFYSAVEGENRQVWETYFSTENQ